MTKYLRKTRRIRRYPEKFKNYVFLTYTEAIIGEEINGWRLLTKRKNHLKKMLEMWEIIDEDQFTIGKSLHSKWIFRIKQNGKYKTRWVIKEYGQKKEIDYREMFSNWT